MRAVDTKVLVRLVAVIACALTATISAAQAEFEVVSIKQNVAGFIDLGGGMRLLRGETRCKATGVPNMPGDPRPLPDRGRCVARNSAIGRGSRFGAPSPGLSSTDASLCIDLVPPIRTG
jgi:hypothetical protein